MKIPKIFNYPGCSGPITPSPSDSSDLSVSCKTCDFTASTDDVMHADYLANFYRLPDVSVVAQRIADRSMLGYAKAKAK